MADNMADEEGKEGSKGQAGADGARSRGRSGRRKRARLFGARRRVFGGGSDAFVLPQEVGEGSLAGPQSYRLVNRAQEDHHKPIYAVQFNLVDMRHRDVFATVGHNRASVYRCLPGGRFEPLQVYIDEDRNELFYSCAWCMRSGVDDPFLIVAGEHGVIRVINCRARKLEKSLAGHAGAINELRTHPTRTDIVASASKDESVRLWNTTTGLCIAVFAGDAGHRDGVLGLDIHLSGNLLVSCGMDHAVMVWNLDDRVVRDAIERSYTHPPPEEKKRSFKPKIIQFPLFSTSKLHNNYVDCVRWLGDFILSKSVGAKIMCWQVVTKPNALKTIVRHQDYLFYDCDIWFVRFGIDYQQRFLCCGNKTGSCYVWDLTDTTKPNPPRRLPSDRMTYTIRHVAFSYDARILLAVTDSGIIWRWDA